VRLPLRFKNRRAILLQCWVLTRKTNATVAHL
jgi:hypothetical protein